MESALGSHHEDGPMESPTPKESSWANHRNNKVAKETSCKNHDQQMRSGREEHYSARRMKKKISSLIVLLHVIACFTLASSMLRDSKKSLKGPSNEDDEREVLTTTTDVQEPTSSNEMGGGESWNALQTSAPCLSDSNGTIITLQKSIPQELIFESARSDSALPFISSDVWVELVDNIRTFFLRPYDAQFPGMSKLKDWLASRPYPVTLVMNNQLDKSWPGDLNNKDYEEMLNQPNLHVLFVTNPRKLDHPKVKPLPHGLKWQFATIKLYGEPKTALKTVYSSVSTSASDTESLFKLSNRTNTVWVRPMAATNTVANNYVKDNDALNTPRNDVCGILSRAAPNSTVCTEEKMSQSLYFQKLLKHRFVASPAGNGLDSHSTWEALLAGCIPIVPRSPLDPMFADLPVWLVDSWEEVTESAVQRMSREMSSRNYDWEKVFAKGWEKEIYNGLCTMPESTESKGAAAD